MRLPCVLYPSTLGPVKTSGGNFRNREKQEEAPVCENSSLALSCLPECPFCFPGQRSGIERKAPKASLSMLFKPFSLLHPGYFEGWIHLTEAPSSLMSGYPAPFCGQGGYKTLTSWMQNCDQHCLQRPCYLCFIQT